MTRSLTIAIALALSAPVLAQTHAEAMARLAPFQGTYALDGVAQIDEGTYAGTLTIAPTLGGHFQEWTWEMTSDGMAPTHLRFITTYNVASRAYTIWRFDSRDISSEQTGALGNDPQGSLQFDGDVLVMAWPTVNPDDPTMRGLFRNTVRIVSSGLNVVTDVQPEGGRPLVAIATTRASRR
ncbi:MAG: hypothetical protein Rubg2KO_07790 [Rubricoccaceae bacterium]